MGVRRAIDGVLSEAHKNGGPYYTLGPLIHNRQAVEMLERRGVKSVDTIDGLAAGTVVIRAHGIPPETRKAVDAAGLAIIDATCPHVRHAQNLIRKYHQLGHAIVIAGDKDHAEVVGLLGFCDNKGIVASTPDEAAAIQLDGPVLLAAQTTFNESAYGLIAQALKARHRDVTVVDTICKSTEDRQREVLELCKAVDAMVVVGGKHSANTRRLAEVAESAGVPAFHVETASELPRDLARYAVVGVTAGASTPNWITNAVIKRLRSLAEESTPVMRFVRRGLKFAAYSNLYTGLGAVALTYACFALQARPDARVNPLHLAIAFCYIYSVYIWSRMAQKQLDELSAPPRVAFYARSPRLLMALTSILAAGSLVVAASLGLVETLLLAAAYLIALAYNLPIGPGFLRYRRLKDIPASKDLFTASAWAAVAVVLPAMSSPPTALHRSAIAVVLAAIVAAILAFVRATMFDFTDIQSDRMLGRETLPVLIGERRTRIHLAVLTAVLAGVLIFGAAWDIFSPLALWLLPCPVFILLFLYPFFHRLVKSELACPLVIDGCLLLAGAIALAWRMI